jgi:PIN domain nuclease of toxin-antitoxin system
VTAVADTHAALWYLLARNLMQSAAAMGDRVAVSSISLVEVVYLVERGRIPESAKFAVKVAEVDLAGFRHTFPG